MSTIRNTNSVSIFSGIIDLNVSRDSNIGSGGDCACFCKVDLASVREDVFSCEASSKRSAGGLVDYGSIANEDSTIRRNSEFHVIALALGCIVLISVSIIRPDYTEGDFTGLKVLISNIDLVDSASFCHFSPELVCGLKIVKVAAECISSSDYVALAGSSTNDITDGNGIASVSDVCPGFRHFFIDEVFVEEEGGASSVSDHPFAFAVFSPIRNGIPIRGLVSKGKIIIDYLFGESNTNVADTFAGIVLEHGKFLSGAHVGIVVGNAILSGIAFPALSPVCPFIRHTNGFKMALSFSFLDDLFKSIIVISFNFFTSVAAFVASGSCRLSAADEKKSHACYKCKYFKHSVFQEKSFSLNVIVQICTIVIILFKIHTVNSAQRTLVFCCIKCHNFC